MYQTYEKQGANGTDGLVQPSAAVLDEINGRVVLKLLTTDRLATGPVEARLKAAVRWSSYRRTGQMPTCATRLGRTAGPQTLSRAAVDRRDACLFVRRPVDALRLNGCSKARPVEPAGQRRHWL